RLNSTKVSPIIEPVNDNIDRLSTTIKVLNNHNVVPHVIVNPQVGDLASDSPDFLNVELSKHTISFIPCIRVHNQNIIHINTLAQQLIHDSVPFSLYLQ
ncbi:ATP-binding protein, partial [Vibrio parahaemolyticus]